MNEQGLKALENLGAELGAAKAENERLRGLLRDLLIEVYVEDDVEPEDIAISEQIKADIHAALSQQAEPCVFHDSDREACQQYSGQVPCEPAPAQDEREAFEAWVRSENAAGCVADMQRGWMARATRPAQTEQQPVAWFTDDHLTDKSATTYDREVAARWRSKGWPVHELYAAPIAQTAPQQNVDAGLLGRIDAAIKAFTSGKASMHVPPEPTDVDMVLGEYWQLVKGIIAAPQPEQSGLADLPYQTLFNAIAAATDAGDSPVSISVKSFRAALSAQGAGDADS